MGARYHWGLMTTRRRAFPADEANLRKSLAPQEQSAPTPPDEAEADESEGAPEGPEESVTTKLFIPIAKATLDEQTICGVVLQPEVVDAQGDIMGADVIRRAAHRFLAQYNRVTKLGLMHKDFKPRFELVESYLAPMDFDLNGFAVKAGSWVMTVKVLDKDVWAKVKKGELTGFSIGGKARVQKLGQTKTV